MAPRRDNDEDQLVRNHAKLIAVYSPRVSRPSGFPCSHEDSVLAVGKHVELAQLAGVYGFCFPCSDVTAQESLRTFLSTKIHFPFALCFMGEDWIATQPSVVERFQESIAPILQDRRYILVNGKPLVVLYREGELPELRGVIETWRAGARSCGLPDLHVVVVDRFDGTTPESIGADAFVELPPPDRFGDSAPTVSSNSPILSVKTPVKDIFYRDIIAESARRSAPSHLLYRGIVAASSMTAASRGVCGGTPRQYGAWLSYLRAWTAATRPESTDPFIFINGWGEWTDDGEPPLDGTQGLPYIEETARSSWSAITTQSCSLDQAREQLDAALCDEELDVSRLTQMVSYRVRASLSSRLATKLRSVPQLHRALRFVRSGVRDVFGRLLSAEPDGAGILGDRSSTGPHSIEETTTSVAMRKVSYTRLQRVRARVAVVVHIFYVELVGELTETLRHITEPFDLHVTTPHEEVAPLLLEILSKEAASVSIHVAENRGRDIGPFVALYRSGELDSYVAVLKIHLKKSLYSAHGDSWRQTTFSELCGDGLTVRRAIEYLASGNVGIVGPYQYFLTNDRFWGASKKMVGAVLRSVGIEPSTESPRFFAGSMFWFAPRALADLKTIPEEFVRFEVERGQQDGTLAHAFERVFCHMARHAGFRCSATVLKGEDIMDLDLTSHTIPVM